MKENKKDKKTSNVISISHLLTMIVVYNLIEEKKRLEEMNESLKKDAMQCLLMALKYKDAYTFGHSLRVAHYSTLLGKEFGLSQEELLKLELAALFHDIGKIGIADSVLLKPGRLNDLEYKEMKGHPVKSSEILEKADFLKGIAKVTKHHHERYDGKGYPEQLRADDIPLYSRIILIADTFDAITSTRPYRKGLPYSVAFQELIDFSGSQFDPHLVTIFINKMKEEENKDNQMFSLTLIEGEFDKEAA